VISGILSKIRLILKPQNEPYLYLINHLGFKPRNIEPYLQALKHKSSSSLVDHDSTQNNERLEFLGDAILNAIITDILIHNFEDKQEGFLTNTRSKIVKRENLNLLAKELGIDNMLKVSKNTNNQSNKNIYGNALEALIGAIYLDQGYQMCKKYVTYRLLTLMDIEKIASVDDNFKSILTEWCQKNKANLNYKSLGATKTSNNNHLFITQVIINNTLIATAEGSNKKISEQNAAKIAIEILYKSPSIVEFNESKDHV
jgi:ribonuclease-3